MERLVKRFNVFSKRSFVYTAVFLTLSLLGGAAYFYLSLKYYPSYASLQVDSEDVQTEIDILKSRRIIEKSIEDTGLIADYFTKRFFIKKEDAWSKVPFRVEKAKGEFYAKEMKILPIDNEKFYLIFYDSFFNELLSKDPVKKIFYFSKEVKFPNFSFVLKKIKPIRDHEEFYLTFRKKEVLIDEIGKRISVYQSSKNSSLIKISYIDTDPKKAREFLKNLIKNYITEKSLNRKEKISKISRFLDFKLREAKKELERAFNELKNYKKEHGIFKENASGKMVNAFIGYEEELRKIDLQLNTLSMIKKEIKKGNYAVVKAYERRYPEVVSLAENIEKLLSQKEEVAERTGELSAEVILLKRKIDDLKSSMDSIIKNIQNTLYKRRASIKKSIGMKNEEVKKLPKNERELFALEQNYGVAKKYYEYLLKEKSSLFLNGVSKDFDVFVVDSPIESDKPVKPNIFGVLTESFSLGAFLSLFAAFLVNREEDAIRSLEDVKALSHLPVYGVIPYVNDHRLYNKIYVIESQTVSQSEAFRNVRTNIEYIKSSGCKVVTVTSTVPGEGKSVIAANLAAILGMGDKKTLLLCADLRTSEMHNKFGISNDKGLSDLLTGKVKIKEVMKRFPKVKNLTIIPSGSKVDNPYDLLESKTMKLLMDNLKEYFDYIVIETPPVDLVSDAFIMSRYSDMTIFVLKSEYSKTEFIKRISDFVEKYDIKNAGFVLHAVKEKYLKRVSYNKEYLFHKSAS